MVTASSKTTMLRYITAHVVKNWYQEHENELEYMEWPPQSPNLNIIEHLWCVFERKVINCYPPLSYLKEQEQVLMKEWLKIVLDEIRKLYDSIPRRIEVEHMVAGRTTNSISVTNILFNPAI